MPSGVATRAERNGRAKHPELDVTPSTPDAGLTTAEWAEAEILAGLMAGMDDERIVAGIFPSHAARILCVQIQRYRSENGIAPPPTVLAALLDGGHLGVPDLEIPELRRWLHPINQLFEDGFDRWERHWEEHLRHLVDAHKRKNLVRDLKEATRRIESGEDFSIVDDLTIREASPQAFALKSIDSREFATARYEVAWHVEDVLAVGQPFVIGGAAKSLKTSIGLDLAISVATGRPFLNEFKTNRAKVGIISGESGPATLQDTARRICESRSIDLAETGIVWCFDIPTLSDPVHAKAFRKFIVDNAIELLLVDPVYLILLTEATAGNASNVFAMGSVLRAVAKIASESGATLLLIHHLGRGAARAAAGDGKPAGLDALSQSGMPEFARQWGIISRRSEYEGDGFHPLWLNYGGSAGHGGIVGVDIREGKRSDMGGRRWSVTVRPMDEIHEEADDRKAEREDNKQAQKLAESSAEVLKFLANGEQRTLREIRERCKRKDYVRDMVIPHLLDVAQIEASETVKARQNVTCYQITAEGSAALSQSGGPNF